MIKINNKNVIAMYINGQSVLSVYTQRQLIWTIKEIIDEILSCYYNGYWIDEYPWTDDTSWSD